MPVMRRSTFLNAILVVFFGVACFAAPVSAAHLSEAEAQPEEISLALERATGYLLSHKDKSGRINSPLLAYGYIGAGLLIDALDIIGAFAPGAAMHDTRIPLIRGLIAQQSADGGFPCTRGMPSGRGNTKLVLETLHIQRANMSMDTEPVIREIDGAIRAAERFLASGRKGPDNPLLPPLAMIIRALQGKSATGAFVAKASGPAMAFAAANEKQFGGFVHGLVIGLLPAFALIDRYLASKYLAGKTDSTSNTASKSNEDAQQLVLKIKAQQERGGGWLANTLSTAISLVALRLSGASLNDPVFTRAFGFIRRQMFEGKRGEAILSFFPGDIWLNAAVGELLFETPDHMRDPKRHEATILSLASFVIADKAPGSGWAFGGRSDTADADCTSAPLRFLAKLKRTGDTAFRKANNQALSEALSFITSVQNDDGGFSSFQRSFWSNRQGLSGLLRPVLFDLSHPDVAARILQGLAAHGATRDNASVQRSWEFLKGAQKPFGGFWGRWFAGYQSATGMVLSAATGIGVSADDPTISKAVKYLRKSQHADGGWGEAAETDLDVRLLGKGSSTPAQTALVVFGLQEVLGPAANEDPQVRAGIAYLLKQQRPDGGYTDPYPVYTIFPGHSYYDYPLVTTANAGRVFARAIALATDE